MGSESTTTPRNTATAGLRKVMTVMRDGPTSATSAKKIRNAIAVATTPSTMIDHHATAGTGPVGRCTHASGA